MTEAQPVVHSDPNADRGGRPPESVFRRRWRKFRSLRRGWYSLLILGSLYLLSFLLPLLVNSRALVVSYGGEYYFPVFAGYTSAETFKQRVVGEAQYRRLQAEFNAADEDNWVLMPPYPFHPNESLLSDPALVGSPPHPPSTRHWMGTDDRARDVFARLLYGFRISITFGLAVVACGYFLGIVVGAFLGYFGGRVDIYGQRFVEIWSGLPFLYTVMIVSSMVRPNLLTLILILAAFGWMSISYYMRGEFYREKAKDYAAAAIATGESRLSVMFRHLLPNCLTPVVSFAPFALVASISSLVALDFLGFGVQPPTASWGELVQQGLSNIRQWHLVVFPLGAMFSTLLMVVFIGEAVREAFDPRSYSRLR